MDDKGGRRQQVESHARRRNGVKSDKQDYMRRSFKSVSKFLKTHYRSLFTCVLLTVLVALLFAVFGQFQAPATNQAPNGANVIDYSTFVDQVNAGNVEAVTIQGNEINALLAQTITQGVVSVSSSQATASKSSFAADFAAWSRYIGAGYSWPTTTTTPPLDPQRAVYTRLPGSSDVKLLPLLRSHQVVVNFLAPAQSPIWLALLWKFVPILLLALVFLLIFAPRNSSRSNRAIDDRVTQIGKSKVRRFERAKESVNPRPGTEKSASTSAMKQSSSARVILDSPVTFEDVAGIDEVRTELEEIVQFLRSPERFSRLGARIPRGALLVGPPGTGKTLLAKAVAGEAGVPFFSMSASEFVEMFVGVGASRVRDLFNQARQSAPCVVFIDEIDAVGRKRSVRVMGNDERDQTLNQLLVELDGFDARQAVVVLAATNRVDILDKALLRPGRFDRHINVSLPDRAGREAILKVHTRKTPLHEDVSLERLARMTTGMSGADLANLVNEAALGAARRDLDSLTHECFEDALARVQLGALRPLAMTETDRRIIAFHEGGHALVAYHLPQADNVNCVTILPRGQSLGVTQFIAEEDRYNYSRETLMARIAVGLGGRVAEELTFGPERVTTGAENDLQVVTDLARRMVTRWGMSEQVGVIFADYSAETAGAGLNMSRVEDELLFRPPTNFVLASLRRSERSDARHGGGRSLIMNEHGRLRLNGGNGENGDLPVRQHAMAMNAPAARTASSATMAAMIDAEVQRILNEGRTMARALLSEHFDQLTKLADALMEQEHLNRKQFEELLAE